MTEDPHHVFVARDHPDPEPLVPVYGVGLAEVRKVLMGMRVHLPREEIIQFNDGHHRTVSAPISGSNIQVDDPHATISDNR